MTEEAERYHQRALAVQEKALGADYLEVGSSLLCLGNSTGVEGRIEEEAKGNYRRALEVYEKARGSSHPGLVHPFRHLGGCAIEAEKMADGDRYYRRVLAIKKKSPGVKSLPECGTSKRELLEVGLLCLGVCISVWWSGIRAVFRSWTAVVD